MIVSGLMAGRATVRSKTWRTRWFRYPWVAPDCWAALSLGVVGRASESKSGESPMTFSEYAEPKGPYPNTALAQKVMCTRATK